MMSGNGSVEVSVPTDLTVTSDGDSEEGYAASRRYARELQNLTVEKSELQKIVEKQRLELQTKDAQLTALAKEHEGAIFNIVSEKDDQISSKKIQINRLEVELARAKEELGTMKEKAARELAQLIQKCSVFQQNQKRLITRQDELRQSLANLHLSEDQFNKLRHTPPQELTLQQYTALRVYEMVWPLRLKLKETEAHKLSLESTLAAKDKDMKSRNELCNQLQKTVEELQRKCDQYGSQVVTLKDEQRSDDFKIRNYARVKAERNQYEEEKTVLSRRNNELELLVATLKEQHNVLEERCYSLRDKTRKQENDLTQYREDSGDLRARLSRITEQLGSTEKQLNLEKERNEDLHRKYIAARGDVTSLRETSSDFHHENRILKEKLQSCNFQCSGLQEKVDTLTYKNKELNTDIEKYKMKYISETKGLDTEIKELKASLSSLSKNRDTLLQENSRLHQEIQSLQSIHREDKASKDKETMELQIELQKVRSIIGGLDELEEEYDKNIKTAAGLPEDEANKILDEMLPKIRVGGDKALSRSIELTRRILVLERHNNEACTTIQQLTEALEHFKNTVSSYKTALGLAGQPSANLLQRIAEQEEQLTALQGALHHCTLSRSTLDEENKGLTREVVRLKQTMDNISVQKNELTAIKLQLEGVLDSIPHLSLNQKPGQRGVSTMHNLHTDTTTHQDIQPTAKPIIITKNVQKRKK